MTQVNPQPIVGVTTRHGHAEWIQKNTHNYLNRLQEYGILAVVLAPDAPAMLPNGLTFTPDALGCLPNAILEHLDGLILSGGGDVDPKYFGQVLNGAEESSIDLKRDELELNLGRGALSVDLPLFGICRGCQVLNVAAGGGMLQHFDNHRSEPPQTRFHAVEVLEGTRLRSLIGQASFTVNTFHHQGIDQATLAPIFAPAGIASPDAWLVEAYESTQHSWVLGVQWHPERIFELEDGHRRIWDSFVEACREKRKERVDRSKNK